MNPHWHLALSLFAPLIETVSGNDAMVSIEESLKEGGSVSVSARVFIIRLPIEGSAAQFGINPQCMSLHSLPPL